VVLSEFEARDPQDHGEREEWFCTGDGAQDTGLGVAFGQSLATSQAEPRCAQQCQKEPDNYREDSRSAIKLRDGIEQLLPVLVERLDGDDRAQTAPMPATNGGSRDGEVPGQAPGADPDHLLPDAMVVSAARM